MPDNTKLELTEQAHADALDEIEQLLSSVRFMGELAKQRKLNTDEATCHLGLIRHAHDNLASLLQVDPLSTALTDSTRMLREANNRIHELEAKLGSDVTAAAAMARLKACEDWFSTWYQLCGWHYMSLDWKPYGLAFDTSDQVEHESDAPEEIMFGDRDMAVKIAPCVPYVFKNYDTKKDTFHDYLLDTQANHEALEKLFMSTFPNARIFAFKSHLDGTDRLLRCEGQVPWEDLEKWHKDILTAAGKLDRPTGKFYMQKADLATRLASRTYARHAGKGPLTNDRARLAWLRIVTGLWDQVMAALNGASQLSTSINISATYPDGTPIEHKFYTGATKRSIGAWFNEQFKCDWTVDLDGSDAHKNTKGESRKT